MSLSEFLLSLLVVYLRVYKAVILESLLNEAVTKAELTIVNLGEKNRHESHKTYQAKFNVIGFIVNLQAPQVLR